MKTQDSIFLLKTELKILARLIRETRLQFKSAQRALDFSAESTLRGQLARARFDFRHKHVHRCLLRGRKLEQIERPGSEGLDTAELKRLALAYRAPVVERLEAAS